MQLNRKTFLSGLLASGVLPLTAVEEEKPLAKFLVMSDTHVERDFMERGRPVYTVWKSGNHASLVKTYEFINNDPDCRDVQFALFLGDQLNTGYTREQKELDAERKTYFETLKSLDLHSKTTPADVEKLCFTSPEGFLCAQNLPRGMKPFRMAYPKLNSRVIAIQGNHDTGVPEFYRECAFTCGGIKFICFFASYVGLPAAPGKFNSTGSISDESLAFVEKEMKAARADKSIKHIVLASHWAIAPRGKNFVHPIIDACKENKYNDNRKKLLMLAKQYGCSLYLNGHEHNSNYPVEPIDLGDGKAWLHDVNCGSVTSNTAAWAIFTIYPNSFRTTMYTRAKVRETENGAIEVVQTPKVLSEKRISFKATR